MIRALIVVCTVVTGCARPPDVLELRLNLPPQDADLALQAADSWEQLTGCKFVPRVITGDGCDVDDCVYVNEVPRSELDRGWFTLFGGCDDRNGAGCTEVVPDGWRVHVRVDETLRERYLAKGDSPERAERNTRTTFVHELGHALGLGHDDDTPAPSVMKASGSKDTPWPTDEDWWRYQEARQGFHL